MNCYGLVWNLQRPSFFISNSSSVRTCRKDVVPLAKHLLFMFGYIFRKRRRGRSITSQFSVPHGHSCYLTLQERKITAICNFICCFLSSFPSLLFGRHHSVLLLLSLYFLPRYCFHLCMIACLADTLSLLQLPFLVKQIDCSMSEASGVRGEWEEEVSFSFINDSLRILLYCQWCFFSFHFSFPIAMWFYSLSLFFVCLSILLSTLASVAISVSCLLSIRYSMHVWILSPSFHHPLCNIFMLLRISSFCSPLFFFFRQM